MRRGRGSGSTRARAWQKRQKKALRPATPDARERIYHATRAHPSYPLNSKICCIQVAMNYPRDFSEVCAISSVVERLLHTQEVAGSNPASRTYLRKIRLPEQFWATPYDPF